MQIIIHRGTHQIGGVSTEIRTAQTRIVIDMGDELSPAQGITPSPLSIPGVTDTKGFCDGVLFTHNHADHVGQLQSIRSGVPFYMGRLAKEVLRESLPRRTGVLLKTRLEQARCFVPGRPFQIGDIAITPLSVDHSACDSYMFLLEAEGKKVLHTGDFRVHGLRGKAVPKIIDKRVGKVDVLIIEGTTLSRSDSIPVSERQLQRQLKEQMLNYKYVFALCASTNLERICAFSKAVPRGKYFVCDAYQSKLLDLLQQYWGPYSPWYRNIKKVIYGSNLQARLKERGFVMMVRDNQKFRKIIRSFDPQQSILLYCMWNGYLQQERSTLPSFLRLTGQWASLHTSGHASQQDLRRIIEKTSPRFVLPIHTDFPQRLQTLCPREHVVLLSDGETFTL